MLIDTFPYFNEKELLELRINLLKDHVDGFIITDANRTHRGEPKEFTCLQTVEDLGLPSDLIKVCQVYLPSAEEVPDPWVRERGQRDCIASALDFLPDDTIFICSDCDEIPNPGIFHELREEIEKDPEAILGLSMSMHYGRADMQLCSPSKELFEWRCATVCTVNKLKTLGSITEVREQPNRKFLGNRSGGWHFSWMGDAAARRLKLRSIAEFYIWDTPEVQERCSSFSPTEGSVDMLGREDHLLTQYPVEDLPQEAVKLERVRRYLLPDG